MRFTIITHVAHKKKEHNYFAYAPYVREMNLWLKHVDEVEIVAPITHHKISNIDICYKHSKLNVKPIPSIQFTSIRYAIHAIIRLPIIYATIFKSCLTSDHIHLRCPGNIGFIGCLVQIFFPSKIKSAKYAGNWDPKSKQPLSYTLQKWILGNRLLTKKMSVLVYGLWPKQSKNIKSFFTATFKESEKEKLNKRTYNNKLKFIFIGSLVPGKRPLFAIKVIQQLRTKGFNVTLDLYGDGGLKNDILNYIKRNNINNYITVKGNQTKTTLVDALKQAHFVILPSKSEGWPKALAEGMFFGAIPIATKISCVPYMLDYGNRGILIKDNVVDATKNIQEKLLDEFLLNKMAKHALNWSQQFTLDAFEKEILKIIKKQ